VGSSMLCLFWLRKESPCFTFVSNVFLAAWLPVNELRQFDTGSLVDKRPNVAVLLVLVLISWGLP
jgi:hypothetical protein